MTKIPREDWVAVKDRLPDDDIICLVTDGEEVACVRAERHPLPPIIEWDLVGASGYEWEFNMEPTHWMALSIQLPTPEEA